MGGPVFAVLLLFLGLAGFREFLALVQKFDQGDVQVDACAGLGTIALLASAAYVSLDAAVLYAIVALAVAVPMVTLIRASPLTARLHLMSLSTLGSLGLGLAVYAAIALRGVSGTVGAAWLENLARAFALGSPGTARGLAWVLVVILITWVNDSGAYLVGRSIGRHLLAPAVSPRKTIEGALAGLIGAALMGAVCFAAFGLGSSWQGALMGGAVGIAGQIGDLTESYLKRVAGVKDSGSLIPGHGGLLDRIDGLLFAFPTGFVLASVLDQLRP